MPRSRINGNFIDKTSSIVANILLRIIPTTSGEKRAFTYYRDGAIEKPLAGRLARDFLEKYQPLSVHNKMGLILFLFYRLFRLVLCTEGRSRMRRKLSSTVLGEGTAYSDRGEQAILQGDSEIAEAWFDQAAEYWKQAIALTPGNYIEAQNWLKITKRFEFE
nr:hypothetical chloroplast RF34 [Sinobambusa tootsik f. albostriata]